jgi:hypothetical protein
MGAIVLQRPGFVCCGKLAIGVVVSLRDAS